MFIPVERSELLTALAAGKGDIALSAIGVTQAREKVVDFSVPVVSDIGAVAVCGPGAAAIASVDDLAGKPVFVRKSSVYYSDLVALNKRFAAEGKPAVIIKEAPEELDDEDLIEMVNAGLIPYTASIDVVAKFWKQVFPKITVHEGITLRTGADIAWAMREGSPQLKTAVNDFVARHAKGTSIGNQIMTRYFKSAKYVKNATSEAERKKFLALMEFFQKYGDQYDVDWLLMAAQGYQESQLNQAARSHVGAIGIMQIMPAAGKDLDVGDIGQVEPNIKGGIKYMRWMIDQYYGDEPMTQLDKALFAFASYNAGAGRISQLRREAAKRGLNPNVWFHNVEYLAAEKIGRGNGDLRQQHLQVLHRLQAGDGGAGRAGAGRAADAGRQRAGSLKLRLGLQRWRTRQLLAGCAAPARRHSPHCHEAAGQCSKRPALHGYTGMHASADRNPPH